MGLGLSGLALMGMGCGGGSQPTQLRVMHAMPTVGQVDVVLDNSANLLATLDYGSASSYETITTSSHTITVEPTGTSVALVNTSLTPTAGTSYTLIESGLGNLSGTVLTDDLTAPGSGKFKLRMVDASPSSGPLDVYVTAPGADLTTATPNVSNLGFPSASAYLNLAAGSYEIRVMAAGSKVQEIDSGTLTSNSGEIDTGVVLDTTGGGAPLNLTLLADK